MAKELNQIHSKAQSQVRLAQERIRAERIQNLLKEWDQKLNDRDEAEKLVVEFEAAFTSSGRPEAVLKAADAKIEEQEQAVKNLGQMHKLLTDARSALAVQRDRTCPVCAQSIDISRLDKALESRIRSLSSGEIAEGQKILGTLKQERGELKAKLEELAELRQQRSVAQKLLMKLSEQIAKVLEVHAISESKVRQRLSENVQKSNSACESLEKSVDSLANLPQKPLIWKALCSL